MPLRQSTTNKIKNDSEESYRRIEGVDLTFLILFLKFPVRNKLSYKKNGFLIWCLVCDFLLKEKKNVISVNCQFIITASIGSTVKIGKNDTSVYCVTCFFSAPKFFSVS